MNFNFTGLEILDVSLSQPLCINSSAVIECNITISYYYRYYYNTLVYYWYYNDSLIHEANNSYTIDRTVYTSEISVSLPGIYTCEAEITNSYQTKNASLEVKLEGKSYDVHVLDYTYASYYYIRHYRVISYGLYSIQQ